MSKPILRYVLCGRMPGFGPMYPDGSGINDWVSDEFFNLFQKAKERVFELLGSYERESGVVRSEGGTYSTYRAGNALHLIHCEPLDDAYIVVADATNWPSRLTVSTFRLTASKGHLKHLCINHDCGVIEYRNVSWVTDDRVEPRRRSWWERIKL